MDEKDNFWAMGETGPCGPCSEIYFDQGSSVGCGRASCNLDCGCDRFLEFWNLVFMQFDRQADGSMQPLTAPSIDTGAGLERLTAILQGVDSNYKTDLFVPLIEAIGSKAGTSYGHSEASDISLQVIADHLRALSFLIADGVVPSNEKRGYILRRIIRRALTYGLNLRLEAPFLHELSGAVADLMGEAYPELETHRARIAEVCRREENTFKESLARGLEITGATFSGYSQSGSADQSLKVIPAAETVKLWTTYGVTTEIQQAMAVKYGVTLAGREEIEAEVEKHREAARATWKGDEAPAYPRDLLELPREGDWTPNRFLGYDSLTTTGARVVAIATDEGLVDALGEGQRGFVVLDRTPFYAESGGQVGDTGQLKSQDGTEAEVDDTQSPIPGMIVHFVTVLNGSIQKSDLLEARVDAATRAATMRNHTATHLLHAALKKILGAEVQQAGSYVGPDRLRFDFNYPSAVRHEALDRIEDEVNAQILANTPVLKEEKGFDEAMQGGAVALFGEKYGERVRVVSVPGFSQELCGGTHCSGTGDIGYLKLLSERGIAAGVRRIEALTGMAAMTRSREDARIVTRVEELLKAQRDGLEESLVNVLAVQKVQARELEKLKLRLAQLEMQSQGSGTAGPAFEDVGGVKLVARRVADLDRSGMRTLADNLKREAGSGVVILVSESGGKVALLASITPDLEGRLDARVLIRDLSALIGGGGGGNALMAEAGGRDSSRLPELLSGSREIVAKHLSSASPGAKP